MNCFSPFRTILTLLLFSTLTQFSIAQSATPAALDIEKIMNPVAKYVDALKSYYVDINSSITVVSGQNNAHTVSRLRLWRTVPGKFYVRAEAEQLEIVVICDGKQIFMFMPKMNIYSLNPAPPGAADKLLSSFGMGGGGTSAYLFSAETRPAILQMVVDKSAKELPEETLNGVACRTFMLSSPPNHNIVWIAKTGTPILVKSLDHSDFNGMFKIANEVSYHWITDKPIPDSFFAIQPPANAQKKDAMELARMLQNLVKPPQPGPSTGGSPPAAGQSR